MLIPPSNFQKAAAVTKSDVTALKLRGLYVGGAGDVAVILKGDTDAVTFKAVPVGTILPFSITKVMSTNTSATQLVGLS